MGLMPFGIDETHGMLLRPGVKIASTSDGRDWTSLYASHQTEPPVEGHFKGTRDPHFILIKDGPNNLKSVPGTKEKFRVGPGVLFLNSAGDEMVIKRDPGDSTLETVHVYVRREIVNEVALEMVDGDPDRIQKNPKMVDSDPVMQALLETSVTATKDDSAGSPLFADFLSRAIASQWIRSYSNANLRRSNGEQGGGRNAKALSQAIDFLKANIDQSIRLEDIGRATNRSASHISRMFSTELGMPPHQYLMRLRVEKAQKLLSKTSVSIAEIAYDCGFSHQEHLSRLFRRFTDTTPAAYRREMQN